MSTFPEKLAALMREKRYNKSTLGKALSVTHSTVSRWLGGSIPNGESANALARILGVSAQWLISDDGPETTPVQDKNQHSDLSQFEAREALLKLASSADTEWLLDRLEIMMESAAKGDIRAANVARFLLPILRNRIPSEHATSSSVPGPAREKTA